MNHSSDSDRRLPVVAGQPRAREERRRRPRPAERGVHAAYGAQVLGQDGIRRGLKGGAPAIDQAHSAYQGAQWCGSAERRRPSGGLTRAFA
jgi:hypothetical protein